MNCTLDVNESLNYQLNYISRLTGKKFRQPVAGDLLKIYGGARKDLDSAGLGYKLFSDNKMAVDSLDLIDSKKPATTGFANAAWKLPEYFNDYGKISRQINTPVLVISGVKDHCVGPDHYRRFQFPHQKICRIDGGHILYYEKTGELINAIQHWL